MAKITDSRTCHIKSISKKLLNVFCKTRECNGCKKYSTFGILSDSTEPWNSSKHINNTNDCLLMSSVCDLLPKPKTDRDDKYYWFYEFVKCSPVDLKKVYAEENLEDGYNQGDYVINNITDGYKYLNAHLEYYYPSKMETHNTKEANCMVHSK